MKIINILLLLCMSITGFAQTFLHGDVTIKKDTALVGKYSSNVTQWNNETTIIIKFYFPGGKQIAEARIPISKTSEAEVVTLKDNQKHTVPTPNNSKETDVAKFLLDRYYF